MKYGIIGAGSTGKAAAAWLHQAGCPALVWDRSPRKRADLAQSGLLATGKVEGQLPVETADTLEELAARCDILLIQTLAEGHRPVAEGLAGHLRPGQILLVTNCCWGAAELAQVLGREAAEKGCRIAETSGQLILANSPGPGQVYLKTVKKQLLLACTDPDHQKAPKLITEENYFFPLEQDRQWLIDYINTHPDWIKPRRFAKEVLGMLSEPLDDLCISRPKSRVWLGVELPFDHDFVTYIWFDALINYISSLGWSPDESKNARFNELWPHCTHLLAKDILKTHAVYWPIMLKALGIQPPEHLIVHGYWLGEGGIKMSKSLGNVVDPYEVMDLMGIEPLRFYLCNAMSLTGDSQISVDLLKQGYKLLANNIGNLQMRVLKMIAKNLGGKVPSAASLNAEDKALLDNIAGTFARIYQYGESSLELVSELSNEILKAGDAVNAYFAANEPWVLAKDESKKERYEAVIYTTLDALRLIAAAVYPFMPAVSQKILASLGIGEKPSLADFKPQQLASGSQTTVGDPLFPYIADKPAA